MRVRSLSTVLFAIAISSLVPFFVQAEAESVTAESEKTEPPDDIKLLAQSAALPALTGKNPFILRESWWNGTIEPGKAKLIQAQLFRRNEYQFWFAVPSVDAGLNLNIYNGEGELVPSETISYDATNVVSARLAPELTGIYYIRISLKTTVKDSQDWAVIYGYR
ncbi:MAG: hypothetical protein WD342_19750 [Verrucomicrobiales bacterium]